MLIMLCKVALTFKTVGAILKCDNSNFSFALTFSAIVLILLYKVVLTFESADENLKCDHSALALWFSVIMLIMLHQVVRVDEILKYDY